MAVDESSYEVMEEREAKSILASKENSEPEKYRGISNVYDFIVKTTDQDILATEDKLEKEFADRYNIDKQLEFLIDGVKPPDYPLPLVHLHVYLKMSDGVLKPVIGLAASHLKGQVKSVCFRYNKISIEELTKRAKAQQKKQFSSIEEHNRFLEDKIKKGEFFKSYALWFLEDDLKKIGKYQDAIRRIIQNEIYPLLKSANDDTGGLYYRDIDESFMRFGLKPIVLFRDKDDILNRYRYLVKEQLLKRIVSEYGTTDIKTEAEALLDRIEDGYENTEHIAQIAKDVFKVITDKLGGQKPDERTLQDLQIIMEVFSMKGAMNTLIQQQNEKKIIALRKKLAQTIDIVRLDKGEKSTPYIIEKLSARNDVYTADYPVKGELVRFFLAKENADSVVLNLERQVTEATKLKDKHMEQLKLEEMQSKIEILEDMLGNRLNFKALRSAYVAARVSNFRKFLNWIKGMFGGKNKGNLEENLWNSIRDETRKKGEKISKKKEAEERRKTEKTRKAKVKKKKKEPAAQESAPKKESENSSDESAASGEEGGVPEEVIKKIDTLANELNSMWSSHLKTISMDNYRPPGIKEVADILNMTPDKVSVFLKKYTPEFKKKGIAYLNLRSSGQKVFITRAFFKKHARVITDIYDIIDQFEFNNPLRNEAGTRRMDFAHDLAAYMHGKGISERKTSQLLKDYEMVLDSSSSARTQEVLSAARFIIKTAKNMEGGQALRKKG